MRAEEEPHRGWEEPHHKRRPPIGSTRPLVWEQNRCSRPKEGGVPVARSHRGSMTVLQALEPTPTAPGASTSARFGRGFIDAGDHR